MKTTTLALLSVMLLSACDTKTYTSNEVEDLQDRGKRLNAQVIDQQKKLNSLDTKLAEKNTELSSLSKQNPKFILKIEFSQSRVSLDIWQHVKDGMNAGQFEIPVDKEFYDSVEVGTRLVDDFRAGSFILRGSFSSWNFKVIDKRIQ